MLNEYSLRYIKMYYNEYLINKSEVWISNEDQNVYYWDENDIR